MIKSAILCGLAGFAVQSARADSLTDASLKEFMRVVRYSAQYDGDPNTYHSILDDFGTRDQYNLTEFVGEANHNNGPKGCTVDFRYDENHLGLIIYPGDPVDTFKANFIAPFLPYQAGKLTHEHIRNSIKGVPVDQIVFRKVQPATLASKTASDGSKLYTLTLKTDFYENRDPRIFKDSKILNEGITVIKAQLGKHNKLMSLATEYKNNYGSRIYADFANSCGTLEIN